MGWSFSFLLHGLAGTFSFFNDKRPKKLVPHFCEVLVKLFTELIGEMLFCLVRWIGLDLIIFE